MKIAFVALPQLNNGRFVVAEDYCGDVSSARLLSGFLLLAATVTQRKRYEVVYLDASIEDVSEAVQECDYVVHAMPYIVHRQVNELMSEICGDVPRILIAIPPGYTSLYRDLYDVHAIGTDENRFGHTVDFSDMPAIDFNLIPERYAPHYNAGVIQVTRGCPYGCTFCSWGSSTCASTRFEMRKPEIIGRDMEAMHQHLSGKRAINLLCAQLTTDLDWLQRFSMTVPPPYTANINLADATPYKLDLLKRSGCIGVAFGLEGASDVLLRQLRKPFDFDFALEQIRMVASSGLPFSYRIRCGFGESGADVLLAMENIGRLREASGGVGFAFGPIIHYDGVTITEKAHYPLTEHPEWEGLMIQADAPYSEWVEFCVEAARLGMLRKFRRFPKKWIREYKERMKGNGHEECVPNEVSGW